MKENGSIFADCRRVNEKIDRQSVYKEEVDIKKVMLWRFIWLINEVSVTPFVSLQTS